MPIYTRAAPPTTVELCYLSPGLGRSGTLSNGSLARPEVPDYLELAPLGRKALGSSNSFLPSLLDLEPIFELIFGNFDASTGALVTGGKLKRSPPAAGSIVLYAATRI